MQTQKTLMLILNFTIICCVLFSAVLLKKLYKKTKRENATAQDDKTAKKISAFSYGNFDNSDCFKCYRNDVRHIQ